MSFAAFLIAAGILAVTPGPGIAYVVARTLAGGRVEGMASCVGTALGGMVHVAAAALGLSLLLAQSGVAFAFLKYVGAAYLAYLGIRLLWRREPVLTVEPVHAQGGRRALLEGIVAETFNVKTALFFVAFLPQFVSPSFPLAVQFVLLGSTCVLLNTLADIVAVFAADRLRNSSAAGGTRSRVLTRISGMTMLGLGACLALVRRQA